MFHQQLTPFLEVFDSKNFLFVDGVRIVSDPNSEFAEFEKFFDLDHELEFEMNEEKGYPCLKKPVKFCLGGEKGNTRGSNEKTVDELFPEEMKNIREFYVPQIEKMFRSRLTSYLFFEIFMKKIKLIFNRLKYCSCRYLAHNFLLKTRNLPIFLDGEICLRFQV